MLRMSFSTRTVPALSGIIRVLQYYIIRSLYGRDEKTESREEVRHLAQGPTARWWQRDPFADSGSYYPWQPTFFATWYPSGASSVGCILFCTRNKELCAAQHTHWTSADGSGGRTELGGRRPSLCSPSSQEKTQLDAKCLGERS